MSRIASTVAAHLRVIETVIGHRVLLTLTWLSTGYCAGALA